MKKVLKFIAYVILSLIAIYLVIWGFILARYVWYTYLVDTELGEPKYQNFQIVNNGTRPFTVSQRAALKKFPDVASCIESKSSNPTTEQLMQMDWSKMKNDAQVEICTFRILSTLGDISQATPWLEQQGFTNSSSQWTSNHPYVGSGDRLSVSGNWNTRENGLRWPESGLKRKILSLPIMWPPYGTSISTTWSQDGTELLYVEIGQTRL